MNTPKVSIILPVYNVAEFLPACLDSLLERGRNEELEKLLFTYIDKVRRIHSGEIFFKTPEFIEVFGDVPLEKNYRCSGISNIDLVPANILLQDSEVSVIDYEWTWMKTVLR